MEATLLILKTELLEAVEQSAYMVSVAMAATLVFGLLLGLLLYVTSNPLFLQNKVVNAISGAVVNVFRSIPFIILLVLLIPFTKLVAGTSIGPEAAVVPIAIASIAFYARLVEGAFSEVDKGVLEAGKATGASLPLIIRRILLVEAFPGLIRATTVTLVSLIGYSAMAGIVGGGGIGDLAIRFGYYRYETGVMLATVLLLIFLVQGIQLLGDTLARRFTRK